MDLREAEGPAQAVLAPEHDGRRVVAAAEQVLGKVEPGVGKPPGAGESIVVREHGPVGLKELKSLIEQKLMANEKLVIVIETEPNADYGLMIDILDELRLANATRISLRTLRGQS